MRTETIPCRDEPSATAMPGASSAIAGNALPTVALLLFSYVFEDFLDKINVSWDAFCNEMTEGWIFGYAEALRRQGVRLVIVCFSGRRTAPAVFTHKATGTPIWAVPVPRLYRWLQPHLPNPYGRSVEQVFGPLRGIRKLKLPAFWLLKETAPYLSTSLRVLADVLRRERCTAILCQEYEFSRFDLSILVGRQIGLPVFAVFQGGDYQRGWMERWIRPFTMRACDGFIIPTRKETERVIARYGVAPGRIARIFNPLDLDLWQPVPRPEARTALGIPPAARVVAWHGRVKISQKGLDTLLEAWALLTRQQPGADLQLRLVGTGQDAAELRRRLDSARLPGVHWTNEFILDRQLMRRHLSAADLYVFPSRHEGFPGAPTEAMACGLPVVATDANGVPDILENGETSGGVMVPRDDPGALARELGRLLDNEPLRAELSRRARQRVAACFSLEAVGAQLRKFLCATPAVSTPLQNP